MEFTVKDELNSSMETQPGSFEIVPVPEEDDDVLYLGTTTVVPDSEDEEGYDIGEEELNEEM